MPETFTAVCRCTLAANQRRAETSGSGHDDQAGPTRHSNRAVHHSLSGRIVPVPTPTAPYNPHVRRPLLAPAFVQIRTRRSSCIGAGGMGQAVGALHQFDRYVAPEPLRERSRRSGAHRLSDLGSRGAGARGPIRTSPAIHGFEYGSGGARPGPGGSSRARRPLPHRGVAHFSSTTRHPSRVRSPMRSKPCTSSPPRIAIETVEHQARPRRQLPALDLGLAEALDLQQDPARSMARRSRRRSRLSVMTRAGVALGTAAYISLDRCVDGRPTGERMLASRRPSEMLDRLIAAPPGPGGPGHHGGSAAR